MAAAGLVACGSVAGAMLGSRAEWADWMARGWPFVILALSVTVIVLLISVARLHAFFALVLSAMAAGFMARPGTLPGEPSMSHWIAAVEQTGLSFGVMAGRIGVIIALASVIGVCLLESGAAEKIVRRFLAVFGAKRAGLALTLGTYVVSIPIFFDTAFLLLVPLARALRLRTGRDYLLYLMGIRCAWIRDSAFWRVLSPGFFPSLARGSFASGSTVEGRSCRLRCPVCRRTTCARSRRHRKTGCRRCAPPCCQSCCRWR